MFLPMWRGLVSVGLAAGIMLLDGPALHAAVADLSDWVGVNNTTGGNNYSVISSTAAGGTFNDRPAVLSSLSDTSLSVPPLNWNSELSMSGTIEIETDTVVDPTLFFGWYNREEFADPPRPFRPNRLGIGIADATPTSATSIRLLLQGRAAGDSGSGIASLGLMGTNEQSTIPSGTYDFSFHHDGDGHFTGTFGEIEWARTLAVPIEPLLQMDTFGFIQTAATGSAGTFVVKVSNLTYTGQTDAAEGLPGDYNGDGAVDAADYVLWRTGSLLADGTGPSGSPDGIVDGLDYEFWRARFGNTSGGGAISSVVPEPSAAVLALTLTAAFWAARRYRVPAR